MVNFKYVHICKENFLFVGKTSSANPIGSLTFSMGKNCFYQSCFFMMPDVGGGVVVQTPICFFNFDKLPNKDNDLPAHPLS